MRGSCGYCSTPSKRHPACITCFILTASSAPIFPPIVVVSLSRVSSSREFGSSQKVCRGNHPLNESSYLAQVPHCQQYIRTMDYPTVQNHKISEHRNEHFGFPV